MSGKWRRGGDGLTGSLPTHRPGPEGTGSYLYGCSPVCVLRCLVRFADRGNILPQYLGGEGRGTVRQSRCHGRGHPHPFPLRFLLPARCLGPKVPQLGGRWPGCGPQDCSLSFSPRAQLNLTETPAPAAGQTGPPYSGLLGLRPLPQQYVSHVERAPVAGDRLCFWAFHAALRTGLKR